MLRHRLQLILIGATLLTPLSAQLAEKGELLFAEDFRDHESYTKEPVPLRDGWTIQASHAAWTRTDEGVRSEWTAGHMPVLRLDGQFGDVVIELDFRFEEREGTWAGCRISPTNRELNPRAYSVSVWANLDGPSRVHGLVLEHDEWKPGVITTVDTRDVNFAPGVWHTLRLEVVGDQAVAVLNGAHVIGRHEKFALPKTALYLGVGTAPHELRRLRLYRAVPRHIQPVVTTDEPLFRTVPAADPATLTSATDATPATAYTTWTRSHGDDGSRRFSALNQINRQNVADLEVAWTYRSGDGAGNIQCNPIVVGDLLIAPTVGGALVGLDATTGEERWRHTFEMPSPARLQDRPARRGLVYWPGHDRALPRVFVGCGDWVYALDPATGNRITDFGADGRVALPQGATAAGVVHDGILIMPGLEGDIVAYDAATGAPRWTFHTIPEPGEFGADTWEGADRDGAHCWGGLSLDSARGIVFAAIGAPRPDFIGVGRGGDNLFSNCVVALDARTGKRLWHFQNIRHDLWDFDNPAPPNLVEVELHGRRVAAVACVTKVGTTLLLDRLTGAPLFPFRLRRAPASTLAGEVAAAYQPDPEWPQPFADPEFRLEDVTDISPAARDAVLAQVARARYGWFAPFAEGHPTLFRSSRGGAEWTGTAIDVRHGRLYVSVNHLLSHATVMRNDELERDPLHPPSRGETLFQQLCVGCHGADRRGTGMVPSLLGLRHRMGDAEIGDVLAAGRSVMPSYGFLPPEDRDAIVDYVLRRNQPPSRSPSPTSSAVSRSTDYMAVGYQFVRDAEGYPGSKPPWGTLACLDLSSGKLLWQVPLGVHRELVERGLPPTGTENFGGPSVTAGDLVFCGGTQDNLIRAFDADTGAELWAGELPWGGYAPPTIYSIRGRQYVVIPASGGGKLRGPTGDAYVAFALPPDHPDVKRN